MKQARDKPRNSGLPQQPSREASALMLADKIDVGTDSLVLGLLEQSDDCIKMLNCEGELDYMNCSGLAAMQISDFSMVSGKKWWDLWPQESQALVRQMFERSTCGAEVSFDAACPTALGEPRRWTVKLKPMVTPDARVAGVLCTSRDIT